MTTFDTSDLASIHEVKESKSSDHSKNKILFVSDRPISSDLRLSNFSNVIEFKKDLFLNRTLEDVSKSSPFLWMDISNSDCRSYLERNITHNPYACVIIYSDKTEKWVNELSEFLGKGTVKINIRKLKNFEHLCLEDAVRMLLIEMFKLSKPQGRLRKIASYLFSCFIKKA
jgi:hypothetical protein